MTGGAGRRRGGIVVVLALLALVNLPFAHGELVGRQIDGEGVDVVAEVVDSREASGGGLVEFRFDADVDPGQRTWQAAVDEPAYERARDEGTVAVRVVPDDPARHRVDGVQGAWLLVALTLFADVVLVLALVLLLRRRPRELRLVALEDVRRARPGGRLEAADDATYLVVGEVVGREPGAVVLDVGERRVRVELGDFENPVGYEQPAQVRAGLPHSAP
jgi:hypothetical protein